MVNLLPTGVGLPTFIVKLIVTPYNGVTVTETIENSVQLLRISAKITQEQLAQGVGVTRQTIIAIEKGSYTPSLLLALKIAHFFRKPVQSIFNVCKK